MIIGLTGPQRAGKTTILCLLATKHRFHPMSIAALIKDEAHRYVGKTYSDEEKDRPMPELGGKTPRDLYIQVGNLDETVRDLWVKRMFRSQYQGPDEWHVIESVGKQFQYTEIVRMCERARDGVVILDSRYSVDETVGKIKAAVAEKGIMLFDDIDQAALGNAAGNKVLPSRLILFGNPALGTTFITSNPEAGLDWPVRVLVYQTGDGTVYAAYSDFDWIAKRHGITDRQAQFKMATEVIQSVTSSVRKN